MFFGPCVYAFVGTSLISLNKRELSLIVEAVRVATWVSASKEVPGSLKAICPSLPIPSN